MTRPTAARAVMAFWPGVKPLRNWRVLATVPFNLDESKATTAMSACLHRHDRVESRHALVADRRRQLDGELGFGGGHRHVGDVRLAGGAFDRERRPPSTSSR